MPDSAQLLVDSTIGISATLPTTFDDDGGFRVRLHTCVREKDLCFCTVNLTYKIRSTGVQILMGKIKPCQSVILHTSIKIIKCALRCDTLPRSRHRNSS